MMKNCEFCISNGKEQIHEQDEIKNRIEELNSEHSNLTANYKKSSYGLEKLGDAEERNKEYQNIL